MFQEVTIRGGAASILWGYRQAAEIRSWAIAKIDGQWTLTAQTTRVDAFGIRQKALLFTAPRAQGWWAWGVESVTVGKTQLVAKLGPPER